MIDFNVKIYRRKLAILVNGVWAIPCVILIRILKPLVLIRTGQIFSERIGHFVQDSSEHYIRRKYLGEGSFDILSLGGVSNVQWFSMLRRVNLVRGRWAHYLHAWNRRLPGNASHVVPSSFTHSRDMHGLFARFDAQIPFTPEENLEAKEWLKSKGWTEGEAFICLLVRDSAYTMALESAPEDLHETSFRNSKIETYAPAIDWLSAQGVWVIRMGIQMNTKLTSESARVIDYSFDAGKSALLDIWLFANCTGCISTASGPDVISQVYRKPLLFLNTLPLWHLNSSSNCIWLPKKLMWAHNSASLSLDEHLRFGFMRDSDYANSGIDIVDNTSEEILRTVQEFWHRLDGSWLETEGIVLLQNEFWDAFSKWASFDSFHEWRHPEFRLAHSWISALPKTFLKSQT